MSLKIGVIYCAYNTRDYLSPSLWPWVNIQYQEGSPKIVICAVNVAFAGFPNEPEDGTRDMLRGYRARGEIDHLIDGPDNIPETTARGMALQYLKDQSCDITWMVDSDEWYRIDEIKSILACVDINPWCDWFRLSLKNFVFDRETHLVEPFTPPRIHRVVPHQYSNLRPAIFVADNDIGYRDPKDGHNGTIWPQDALVSRTIPTGLAWIRHITWQNDLRAKRKIEYQLTGRGWPSCSFAWDEQRGLIFNPALPVPKIARD